MTIYTGFEIEVESDLSKHRPSVRADVTKKDILNLAQLTSKITGSAPTAIGGYHDGMSDYASTKWRLEQDCSLRHGAEFISPPEPIDISMEKVFKFFEYIEESGCTTTERCGLHVNMSSDNMTLDDVNISAIIPLINQRLLFKLWGKRMTNNSNVIGMKDILKRNGDNLAFAYSNTKHYCTKIDKAGNSLLLDRYNFVNNREFSGKSYIEIRIIGGEEYHKRANDIKQTVEHFVEVLKKASKKTPITYKKITSYINRTLIDVKNKDSILNSGTGNTINSYIFKNKIKQINNIHKYTADELADVIRKTAPCFAADAKKHNANTYEILCNYFSRCALYINDCVISYNYPDAINLEKKEFHKYINYHRVKFLYNNFGKSFCLKDIKNNNLKNISLPEDEPKRNLLWLVRIVRHLTTEQKKNFVNTLPIDLLDFLLKHKQPSMINMVKARKKELIFKTGE